MPYAKLRGRIREIYQSEAQFAKALGVCKSTLSSKLNGKIAFKSDEIMKCCELLNLSPLMLNDLFFAKDVLKN
jgi:hypothetical protein